MFLLFIQELVIAHVVTHSVLEFLLKLLLCTHTITKDVVNFSVFHVLKVDILVEY